MKRSVSAITKFLPRTVRVEEISIERGPSGKTRSILNVNAKRAKNALTPPPVSKENNRFALKKKRNNARRRGITIQIIGALKLFLLPVVE
jgi:predicted nucleic acid-binding Zn ribbon protein